MKCHRRWAHKGCLRHQLRITTPQLIVGLPESVSLKEITEKGAEGVTSRSLYIHMLIEMCTYSLFKPSKVHASIILVALGYVNQSLYL